MEKYTGIIYKYTNLTNNKIYIGQTVNEKKRTYQHLYASRTYFDRALKKYGITNFKYEIIVKIETNSIESLKNNLNYFEKFYISYYDSYNSGYNLTQGGDGCVGRKVSEDTKKKMSKDWHIHHDKQFTDEFKNKISNTLKGNIPWNKGKKMKKAPWNKGKKGINCKSVQAFLNGSFIGVFDSVYEASCKLNVLENKIRHILNGDSKITKEGYSFKYL